MDRIKEIATDFVKSLSQEALEIVKDKIITPDTAADTTAEIIPQVQITYTADDHNTFRYGEGDVTSEPEDILEREVVSKPEVILEPEVIPEPEVIAEPEVNLIDNTRQEEEISTQFQFQTSFRSHFVAFFDEDSQAISD